MKQTRGASLFESVGNTLSGFFLSLTCQFGFLVWLKGLPMSWHDNFEFAVFMTFVSVARSYGWRRLMEAFHVRRPLTPFMQAVVAEVYRQQEVEGYDAAHDDGHLPGVLAAAGAGYLANAYHPPEPMAPHGWPWQGLFWNPKDPRRNLVRGCALGLAEGNKLDRARKRKFDPQKLPPTSAPAQWPTGGVL